LSALHAFVEHDKHYESTVEHIFFNVPVPVHRLRIAYRFVALIFCVKGQPILHDINQTHVIDMY
jgi:hypothetical protein